MRHYVDLHIHSKYARATSTSLDIQNLEKWAKIKGLSLLGTGDFTHPKWFKEVCQSTNESAQGILSTKGGMQFIWQTEISFVFTQGGKGRRVHLIVLAPNSSAVKQLTSALLKHGRVDYDGRPIFGMSCAAFTELAKDIDQRFEIIPAHAWTPWFSVFGSKSGFDSLKECFLDQTKHIHAIETGMSSDPKMNWRLSPLDNITLISNSDAHSFWPWRLGRECNVIEAEHITYEGIIQTIRSRRGLIETIEVDPGYGKYHFDGHRACGVRFSPVQSKKHKGLCPKCKRPLTIGVQARIEQLADRPDGYVPKNAVPFRKLLPLSELIAHVRQSGTATKKVWEDYNRIINICGNEHSALIDAPEDQLRSCANPNLCKLILKNRAAKLVVDPGFDGEYGKILS